MAPCTSRVTCTTDRRVRSRKLRSNTSSNFSQPGFVGIVDDGDSNKVTYDDVTSCIDHAARRVFGRSAISRHVDSQLSNAPTNYIGRSKVAEATERRIFPLPDGEIVMPQSRVQTLLGCGDDNIIT
jgi:hypothetical protein